MSLPTLLAMASDRSWTGKVSASMVSSGARYYYLKQTVDYSADPQSRAFMLSGTKHHSVLEKSGRDLNALLEEYVDDDIGMGTFDYFDGDIYDYKMVGSYAVAKHGVFELFPTGEFYKRDGKYGKKDDPKMEKRVVGFSIPQTDGWAIQCNRYRMLIEAQGFEVKNMFIQATIRDGGTQVAKNRGIHKNIYTLPVPLIGDILIQQIYLEKQSKLNHAFENREIPEICNDEEKWNGIRCDRFCEVVEACKQAGGWDE